MLLKEEMPKKEKMPKKEEIKSQSKSSNRNNSHQRLSQSRIIVQTYPKWILELVKLSKLSRIQILKSSTTRKLILEMEKLG